MSLYATSLEDHLLPDRRTLEEIFPGNDKEEWIGRYSVCTITSKVEEF